MFRKSITQTALTSQAANELFTNITGDYYRGDRTFLASLRALIAPRIEKNESISVTFGISAHTKERLIEYGTTSQMDMIMGYDTNYKLNNNKLYVHNFVGTEESVGYSFTVIDMYFKGTGYKKIEKVTQFYSKSFNVSCYINEDMKSAALFVDNLDMRKMHYLQVSIVAILPWFFKGRAEVTPLEMELICSLSKKSEDEYLKVIQKIASGYDFRSGKIKRLLEGFETQFEKLTLSRAKEDRTRIERDLESLQREFNECLKRRNEALIRILGVRKKRDNA